MGCSTLEAAVEHILEEMLSSSLPLSPLSPLTPPVPPLLQSADHYQQVDLSGVVGLPPQGAAPHQLEQPQSFVAAPSLSENLSGVVGLPPQGAAPHQLEQPQSFMAAPSLPYVHVPTATMAPNLIPVGYFNGQVVYGSAGHFIPPDSAAPFLDVRKPKKRKRDDQLEEDQPYIKKPLNAFMMFRKEQRPVLMADMNINDNAIINKLLGERWRLLPKEEQQKYFLKAEEGRLLHILQHPDWSARDNYGRNRSSRRPHTHVGRNTANSSTSSRFSAPQAVVIPSAPQAPQTVMMPFGSMSYDLPDFYGPQQPLQLHHPQQFCPPLPQADWSQYQWASFNPQFPL